jgi:hypothetical protein
MNKFLSFAAVLIFGFCSQHAQAGVPVTTVYCIDSSAEFATVASSLNSQTALFDNIDMRFRPGVFTFVATPSSNFMINIKMALVNVFTDGYNLRVSGEWNSGCSAQNTPGTSISTLDGSATKAILRVETVNYTATSDSPIRLQIDHLSFQNYFGVAVSAATAGIGHSMQARYLQFRNGQGPALNAGTMDGFDLQNSLFETINTGNQFDLVQIYSAQTVAIFNNTFRNIVMPPRVSSGAVVSLGQQGDPAPSGYAIFENNIIWNTNLCTQFCFLIETDNFARVRDNVLDATKIIGQPLFLSNNYNINPGFSAASGAALASNSPARDIGRTSNMAGVLFDLAGNARIQNAVVDLGAFEVSPPQADAIFANAFE